MKETTYRPPAPPTEHTEHAVATPSLEQFDAMTWLSKLSDVRRLRESRIVKQEEVVDPPLYDSVAALQENMCPSHALARVARVTRDAGKQYGEVWHLCAPGWICQKHEFSSDREKDQFLDYYLEHDVSDAPIAELLDESQLAELEHTGFVATGKAISTDEKNAFARELVANMQHNFRALGIDEPLERVAEELSLEGQQPEETVSLHLDELLDTFTTNWMVLATEPVTSIRRTPTETIVGVNATVIPPHEQPMLQMRYYRHDGTSLSVFTDEKRPAQEIFDREAADARIRLWQDADERFRPARAQEAAFLAEYLHTCTHVASLLGDMQEAADTRLPDAKSFSLGKMMPGALHETKVRTVALTPKQIDAQAPSYMQMVCSDTGDHIDARHVYMGYYEPETNTVYDMQLSYHSRTGTVQVAHSVVSGTTAADVARVYRDTSKPHRTATADTIRDVFRTPYGEQEAFFTEANDGRQSRILSAHTEYPSVLAFIERWSALTPPHASKRNKNR